MASSHRALLGLAMLLLGGAAALPAQGRGAPVALRIWPRAGDTLHTRLEQRVDMTGATRMAGRDSTMWMRTVMLMLSRVAVEGHANGGTVVTTITDSVAMAADGSGPGEGAMEAAKQMMEGLALRMHISPRGSATLVDVTEAASRALPAIASSLPATLPAEPVRVGGTWSQTLPLAAPGQPGRPAVLTAVFRLDSVTRRGTLAYISMRGSVTRDAAASALPQGGTLVSTGSVDGRIVVDLARGWWTESHASIAIKSVLTPPPSSGAAPMRFHTAITQRMRVAPRR